MKERLLNILRKKEELAGKTRWHRFIAHPRKYLDVFLLRKLRFAKGNVGQAALCNTFFDTRMKIMLPSSLDIYLLGLKTHSSEIRLIRYLIQNIQPDSLFVDIGAHFGFFTLLVQHLKKEGNGKIYSYEPSTSTFHVLRENTKSYQNVACFQAVVGDSSDLKTFFELPVKYSEFNSIDVEQYKDEAWFDSKDTLKTSVHGTTLDQVGKDARGNIGMIKIDTEGSEAQVIKGGRKFLTENAPLVIMEYLCHDPTKINASHALASRMLNEMNYEAHRILKDGILEKLNNINGYMLENQLDSENIVFKKS